MKPESSPNPRQQLEARVTALLLGEITGAEADNLRQAIAQDAELTKLYERLKSTIELVRETSASPAEPVSAPAAPLKLSEERRQKLLAHFKTVAPKEFAEPPRDKMAWLIPVGIAACLALFLGGVLYSEKMGASRGFTRKYAAMESSPVDSINASAPEPAQESVPRRGKGEAAPVASAPAESHAVTITDGADYAVNLHGSAGSLQSPTRSPSTEVVLPSETKSPDAFVTGSLRINGATLDGNGGNGSYNLGSLDWSGGLGGPKPSDSAGSTVVFGQSGSAADFNADSFSHGLDLRPPPSAPASPSTKLPTGTEGTRMSTSKGITFGTQVAPGLAADARINSVVPSTDPRTGLADGSVQSLNLAMGDGGVRFGGGTVSDRSRAGSDIKGDSATYYGVQLGTNTLAGGLEMEPTVLSFATGAVTNSIDYLAFDDSAGLAGNRNQVPVLGNLPAAGQLFGSRPKPGDDKTKTRGETQVAANNLSRGAAKTPGTFEVTIKPQTEEAGKAWSERFSPMGRADSAVRAPATTGPNVYSADVAGYVNPAKGAEQLLASRKLNESDKKTKQIEVVQQAWSEPAKSGVSPESTPSAQTERVPKITLVGITATSPARVADKNKAYDEAKLRLEELRQYRTALGTKIASEQADLSLPKASMVEIIDHASPEPAKKRRFSEALTGNVERVARLKVERDVTDIDPTSGSRSSPGYDPYFVQTEFEVLQSEAVLGKAVEKLNLNEEWAKKYGHGGKLNTAETVALLKKQLDLRAVPKTSEIDVSVKSDNPEEAARIANAIADAYQAHRLEQNREQTLTGIQALETQWKDSETKLQEAQARVDALRAELKISGPDGMTASVTPTPPVPQVEVLPGGMVNFSIATADQFLAVYAELTGKQILRTTNLPSTTIAFKPTQPMTKAEAIKAVEAVLATNGITIVNVGDKFAKAMPITQVTQTGATVSVNEDKPLSKPAVPLPVPQPELQTRNNAFSTFSLNVSDVSFKLAAASLQKGVLPEPGSIRSEEFINAFDYRDPEPAAGAPVAFAWERARYPFAHNRDLLRFSLKTAASGRQPGRALNLVLLLDNSGSMERADRVGIIREALRVLASQLQPQDKLSVVTFARTPQLRVDGVSGSQAGKVAEEVGGFTPEGGTNLEEAMNLAYATALRHYLAGGLNRIVLLTDGAANLGNVAPEALKQKVEAHRQQGLAFDCFGIGWEGYNDDLLEVLSRNGDGRYGFINTPEEAASGFAGQLAGALQVAASDVKVQVEFNPARVTAYRQIGYAKHQLTKEQFRDNTVDAAEIGAAESGNALYVIEVNAAGEGPLATVRVRYKVPGTSDYREQEWAVPFTGNAVSLDQSSPAMKLAASASAFSEWLATSPYAGEVTPDQLLGYLRGVPEIYGADARPKTLEWMIRQAKSLAGK